MKNHEKQMIDNVLSVAKWAAEYIEEYEKSGHDFDPFKVLSGTDDKKSKLFTESINFLHELEETAETFKTIRHKVTNID